MRSKIPVLIIAVGVCGLFVLRSDGLTARPKRPDKVRPPAAELPNEVPAELPPDMEPERGKPQRYERLLIAYLANIDRLRRERQETSIRAYQKRLRYQEAEALDLVGRGDALLADLQREAAKRRNKKIDFEGECYENHGGIVVPTSDISAGVFRTLYRADAVVPEHLIGTLCRRGPFFSADWLSLIKKIGDDAGKDSPLWRTCIKLLYRAGVSRETYRPMLRRMAEQDHDVSALEALFFDIDPEDGTLKKVVTYENLAIMKALAQPGQPPGIRIACAHYATKLHDYTLAESVCLDVFNQPYQGLVQRVSRHLPEDMPLHVARRAAMLLMFYGIRNERAFEAIYARSRIHITELAEHRGGDDTGWISFDSYVMGEVEIRDADSYVSIIKKLSGNSPK